MNMTETEDDQLQQARGLELLRLLERDVDITYVIESYNRLGDLSYLCKIYTAPASGWDETEVESGWCETVEDAIKTAVTDFKKEMYLS